MTELLTLENKYKEVSKAYAEGFPLISDSEFDELEEQLRALGSALVDMVSEDFLDEATPRQEVSYETFSIRTPKSWEAVEEFFLAYPECTFVAALKVDGVCTKVGVGRDSMVGESRNRNARVALDFTDAVNIMLDKPFTLRPFTVTGESYVPWDDLEHLRQRYAIDKYVMPRSAAISLLRTPKEHEAQDVKLMKFMAFATDNRQDTYEEELLWLESRGFTIPKYQVFKYDTTRTAEEQLTPIMDLVDTGLPSDGVVFQVNERGDKAKPQVSGKYLSTQIAVKLGKWAGVGYEAIVTGINYGKAKGNKGITLQIEPFVTEDNATITKVNAYNMGIVRRLKIKKGSRITFERVSNNMCNLTYR